MLIKNNKKSLNLVKNKCGLCGSTKKPLIKTQCCDNWICDDADQYVPFSYETNSCYRNHDRYTVCAFHFHEQHTGKWQNCKRCKDELDKIDYTDFGTNEFNFEVLKNPEKYTIKCVKCGFTSNSTRDFAYKTSKGYVCTKEACQGGLFNFEK